MKRWLTRACLRASLFLAILAAALDRPVQAQNSVAIEIVPNIPHSQFVSSIAVSPDGKSVLSGSEDGTLKLWNVASGRLLRTFDSPSPVTSSKFSPDGRIVFSGSRNGSINFWDVTSGERIRTITAHPDIVSVAISPDGRTVLSGSQDRTLKLWDATSGQLLWTFTGHSGWVNAVAFSPDGDRVLSGSADGTLKLWDVRSGRLFLTAGEKSTATKTNRLGSDFDDAVTSVAFSPDGQNVVAGGMGVGKTLRLWNVASGQLTRQFVGHPYQVSSVAYSPDGRIVLSGGTDNTVKLWEVASGKLLRTFTLRAWSNAVAISADGETIFSGNQDNTVTFFDLRSGKNLQSIAASSSSIGTVIFQQGRGVLSATQGKNSAPKLWAPESGRLLRAFAGEWSEVVALALNGRIAASAASSQTGHNNTLKLWDFDSNKLLRTLRGHRYPINAIAFSSDGRRVLSGSNDRTGKLWEVPSGRLLRTLNTEFWVTGVALSPDGGSALVAAGGGRGVGDTANQGEEVSVPPKLLYHWDLESGRLLKAFDNSIADVDSVAFSPDGRTALGGGLRTITVWDVQSGRHIKTFDAHSDWVRSLAFSADGLRALSGSADGTIKLWDVPSGTLRATFLGHWGPMHAVFSPDEKMVVSGGRDGTIRFWNANTGALVAIIVAFDNGEWVTITSEGFFDSSADGAKLLSVVRGLEVYSVDQFYQALYRPDLVRQALSGEFDARLRVDLAAHRLNLEKVLDSGPAPEVAILSPRNDTEIDDTKVMLDAKIVNQGGGIGRIEWRINGVALGVQYPDENAVPPAKQIQIKRTFALSEGINVIEVVAYNKENLAASLPAWTTVLIKSKKPRAQPHLHVLAIGVDKYIDKSLELHFAASDARSISAAFGIPALTKQMYEKVIVHNPVLDDRVTSEYLSKVFEDLNKAIRPDDVFVLYMAGHGVTDDGRYYFLPYDTKLGDDSLLSSSIGQDRLQEWIAQVPAMRSILIYDTCESGSATEERSGFRGEQRVVATEKLSRLMGRTVLAASTDTGFAKEGYKGHGLFTYAVLDGFALSDENKNGRIEVSELAKYLTTNLPKLSEAARFGPQVPQIKIVGFDFSLAKRINISEIDAIRR
jgi:WD40 repeat protein